jgi:5-methylcytosine-specific restriction endonuclease McrA
MKHPLTKKICNFYGDRDNYKLKYKKPIVIRKQNRNIVKILRKKILRFCHKTKGGYQYFPMRFKVKDLLEKIGDHPICQLTGRRIDLSDGPSYHLDHIIPKTKGGSNDLDNCQLLCKQANQAKANMLTEEFIQLCREVLDWYELGKTGQSKELSIISNKEIL